VRLYYCSPFLSTTAYYSMAAGCASFGSNGREARRGAALAHVQEAPHQSLLRQLILRGVF
jgi:hypothetical protein